MDTVCHHHHEKCKCFETRGDFTAYACNGLYMYSHVYIMDQRNRKMYLSGCDPGWNLIGHVMFNCHNRVSGLSGILKHFIVIR